jgi:hypothetical protein
VTPRPRAGLAALLVVVALAACCAQVQPGRRLPEEERPPGPSTAERAQIDEAEQALRRDQDELGRRDLQAAPDCARVCQLVGNICALAERVCRIAGRYPETDPVTARCTDDRARCARAREETKPRCTCPAP